MTQAAQREIAGAFTAPQPQSLSYASRGMPRKPRPRSLISALISLTFAFLLILLSGAFLIGAVIVEGMNYLHGDFRMGIEVICGLFAFGCFGGAGVMGIMGLRWLPRSID